MTVPLNGVGIVSEVPALGLPELTRVASAIGYQIVHDVAPEWGVVAAVQAFDTMSDIPDDYARLLVTKAMSSSFYGLHKTKDKRYIAWVRYTSASQQWVIYASHEVIELLVDPDGQRIVPGPHPIDSGRQVEYLVEPCDPVQDPAFSYTATQGLPVSNFCTQAYYQLAGGAPSFRPGVNSPFTIAEGGYLTWRDPATQEFWMTERSGGVLINTKLGTSSPINGSLRVSLDRLRPEREGLCSPAGKRRLKSLGRSLARTRARQRQVARRLRPEIDAIHHREWP